MKIYRKVEVYVHAFFTSALDEIKWSASQPSSFTLSERPSNTHGVGGWMCPRFYLDGVEKQEVSCPCWESNPNFSAIQPLSVAIPNKLSFYFCMKYEK
jgi:hypothetical protein